MRIQDGHFHAYTEYAPTNWKHYVKLLWSVIDCKLRRGKSLTVHLPYEIQHPKYCGPLINGVKFLRFGERLKRFFKIKLYWENAPWLNVGTWDLKFGNTDFDNFRYIPGLEFCLDVGHLMLGSKTKLNFYKRLKKVESNFGIDIKHLHLHENDLVHDQHSHTQFILAPSTVERLTRNRTFIWEKSA